MARDRTLPRRLAHMRGASGTPAVAVGVTGAMVAAIAVAVGDVAVAGAASSLIFLLSFAMVHWAAILADLRSGRPRPPLLPAVGAAICLALAVFQTFAVPHAGSVIVIWVGIGVALYLTFLAPGARLTDVSAEARDPDLARLRGRSPLVLVPIANPARAASLVDVAATLRTPGVGRVLLLSVLDPPDDQSIEDHLALRDAQTVLGESLLRSLESSLFAETLFTIAADPWTEIARVAERHRCETVLVGLPNLSAPGVEAALESLIAALDSDAVVLRAPRRWSMDEPERVIVPLGGRGDHSRLRVRLLASLSRSRGRSFIFLGTLPPSASAGARRRFERELTELARDEAAGPYEVVIDVADRPEEAIVRRASDAGLVVMGMQRGVRGERALGGLPLAVALGTEIPLVLIGQRPNRGLDFVGQGLRAP